MVNIRQKGAKAELEFCKRFDPFFPNTLERNLLQTREGGSDVTGCYPFVIEVKRVEKCDLGNKNSWWRQVCAATINPGISVVAFRPSRSAWRFLIPANLLDIDDPGWMEISEETWLKLVLRELN